MTIAAPDDVANRGGKALREHQTRGRITRPWESVPKSERRKWVTAARIVLDAALTPAPTVEA